MEETSRQDQAEVMLKKHENVRKVAKRFCVYAFGYFMAFGPYVATLSLQSSVNIEEGLGTLSLGITFTVSFIFAIFFTPSLIRRFGCKPTLLLGELSYLLYIVANFYPAAYTLIPAGIVVGIGGAFIWTAVPMFNVHYGRWQAKYGSRIVDFYIRNYIGFFFCIFELAQIFGNAVSYAILYGGKDKTGMESTKKNVLRLAYNETEAPPGFASSNYQFCGANDCQIPNVTNESIDQYVPSNPIYFYILISVYCAMCSSALLLHVCFLPNIKPGHLEFGDRNIKPLATNDATTASVALPSMWSTIKATLKHSICFKQVLLVPLLFYHGLAIAFALSELTRAYTSCVLGVEQVGLSMTSYAAASGFVAAVSGRLIGFFGRNRLSAAIYFTDILNHLFCLLWRPEEDTAYLVYFTFVGFGITDGLWKNVILGIYMVYFPENQEIAFSVWNVWITIGIAVEFFWSPLLCVSIKIYLQLGLLTLSIICYGVAERSYRKEKAIQDKK